MGPSLCTLCTAQKPQGLAGNNEESANPCVGGGGKEVEERSWEDRSDQRLLMEIFQYFSN